MKGLIYQDVATVLRTQTDEYGDEFVADSAEVGCLFRYGMSLAHSNYVDSVGTDAHAYLDINNQFIIDNRHRLEGMYLIFNRYGNDEWYRIDREVIGRTLLTTNEDNCLHVNLSKVAPLQLGGTSS